MRDRFYKICAIVALVLLFVVAFNSIEQRQPVSKEYPYARNPVYKVFETEPDARQINEILTKYGQEGAFELAAAPLIKSDRGEKVLLVLVQRW